MLARPSWAAASTSTSVFLFLLAGCDAAPSVPGADGGLPPGTDAPIVAEDAPRPGRDAAVECSTDADCDDGDPATHEYCHTFFHTCIATECTADAHCDDGDPCTLDYCLSMASCGHGSDGRCCAGDADCFDGNDCTSDYCGDDQLCDWAPVAGPGCGTCS